jgi:hypothetical protein
MNHEPIPFDFARFQAGLTRAARDAFRAVRRDYGHEQLYVCAFYAAPMYSHLFASANSEAALTRTAARYLAQDRGRGWYAGLSIEDVGLLLRDVPADWEYHCFSAGIPAFDALSGEFGVGARWYERVVHRDHALPETDAWDALQRYLARMRAVCAEVLRTLDDEGLFGSGAAREDCTLALLIGDSSLEERLHWIEQLNPPTVAARYAEALDAASATAALVTDNMQRSAFW